MKTKWKELGSNSTLTGKGFYISYNADTNAAKGGLGEIYNMLGSIFGSMADVKLESDGRAETALVKKTKERNIFYILNGDFRKEYEKLLPKGFAACKKFYLSKPECKSNWSTK